MEITTAPTAFGPRYQKRADGFGVPENACCMCAKDTDGTRWVRVDVDCNLHLPDAVLPDHYEMGLHPIGPDCARAVRTYVIRKAA